MHRGDGHSVPDRGEPTSPSTPATGRLLALVCVWQQRCWISVCVSLMTSVSGNLFCVCAGHLGFGQAPAQALDPFGVRAVRLLLIDL